jgi:anaerobic selenocysteine-containing dehydrogenase
LADELTEDQSGVTRRQFLQVAAASGVGAVAFTGCGTVGSHEFTMQSRPTLSEDLITAYENWYATACSGCAAGCGVIVRIVDGYGKKIEGNPDHPLNLGKSCARAQAVVQEEYHPDRLHGPMRRQGARGSGNFVAISWDEALAELGGKLRQIRSSGRQSDVVLVTGKQAGQQAVLASQFMSSYGGEWRIFDDPGEAPLREAVRRVFGSNQLPEFDIANARFVLSIGSDFLGSWVSQVHYNIEYGMFRQGDYRPGQFRPRQSTPRGYLIQAEPQMTATGAAADEWVWVRPGMEGLLALSIGQALIASGAADGGGVSALGGASAFDAYAPDRVTQQLGVPADKIRSIAQRLASTRPAVVIGGGPAGAHTNGTENLTAILALNTLIGAVGRTGGVLINPEPVLKAGNAPRPTNLNEWQRLAERISGGSVQALLLKDANPAYSLPATLKFEEALRGAPDATTIVSFSSFMDESTAMADLILPAHLPMEDWGIDIPDPMPGFQVLTVQQPVMRPFFDTRSFGDVLLALAGDVGGPVRAAVPWQTQKEAVREAVRPLLSERRGSVRETDFERFWVRLLQQGGWWDEAQTGNGSATTGRIGQVPAAQFAGDEQQFPFHLIPFVHNTLGSGEGAHLPWMQATPDPMTTVTWQSWVEINPGVADQMRLREGDVVAIETPQGRIEVPVYVSPAAAPNVLAVPMGQGHKGYGRWAERRGANPISILAPLTDQATGALAYGATRARLVATGRHISVPKYEGTAHAEVLEEAPILR